MVRLDKSIAALRWAKPCTDGKRRLFGAQRVAIKTTIRPAVKALVDKFASRAGVYFNQALEELVLAGVKVKMSRKEK